MASDDEEMRQDFENLVEHLSDEDAAQHVQIVEIAEQASVIEVLVPIANFSDPEAVLLKTMAEFLLQSPRRALISVAVAYQIRSHNLPYLIGTFVLSDPLSDDS